MADHRLFIIYFENSIKTMDIMSKNIDAALDEVESREEYKNSNLKIDYFETLRRNKNGYID